jgi:hypothetical protein
MSVCYDKWSNLTRSDTKVGTDIVIESTGMFVGFRQMNPF